MPTNPHLTDESVLQSLGARLEQMRLQQNLTQAELAARAALSKRTIERLESGEVGAQLSSLVRALRALGQLERLDLLLPEPVPSPMEALKREGKKRTRASGQRSRAQGAKPWTWGDRE